MEAVFMVNASLATYLNDHLAGSVGALDLLAHLASAPANDRKDDVLDELRAGIQADQNELEAIIARAGVGSSLPRKAAAWMAAKIGELKLRVDDSSGGAMRRLEGLEMVAIGIDGKLALWHVLAANNDVPELMDIDAARLIQRAVDQRARIEILRIQASRAAFSATR